jgi:hypothetical protein
LSERHAAHHHAEEDPGQNPANQMPHNKPSVRPRRSSNH